MTRLAGMREMGLVWGGGLGIGGAGRVRHGAVARVRYVARNGDTARHRRAPRQGGVLTKTLISMGSARLGLFGSSILAFWGWG